MTYNQLCAKHHKLCEGLWKFNRQGKVYKAGVYKLSQIRIELKRFEIATRVLNDLYYNV